MKRYIRAKTFVSQNTGEKVEIDRVTKSLTIKYCVGEGYYKNGKSYDSYTFIDAEGNKWFYHSPVDYNGRATTAIGKALQELDEGSNIKISGYFIPSDRDNIPGTILNPRLLR